MRPDKMAWWRAMSAAALCLVLTSARSQAASAVPVISVSRVDWPKDLGQTARLGRLVYRGGVTLSSLKPDFRGYSGIWVSRDGKTLLGVEAGKWVKAALAYDRDNNLSGFAPTDGGWLLDEAGKPFALEDDRDAEALDFDGKKFLVGFETHDRVLTYKDLRGPAEAIFLPPEALRDIMRGAGYSSVAVLKGGGTAFLAEYTYPDAGNRTFVPGVRTRGWLRHRDGSAGPFWLRPTPKWLPVDLRQLPDGDLLLVQEHIGPGAANIDQSRLSRVKLSSLKIGATIDPEELAVIAAPIPSPRVEAITIGRGAKGETLIYVMTNTSPAQLFLFELKPR